MEFVMIEALIIKKLESQDRTNIKPRFYVQSTHITL